jgi:hypothetical protein
MNFNGGKLIALNNLKTNSKFQFLPELLLGIFEALGDVVDGLVLLVLVGLDGCEGGLEGPVLGLVADGVQQLSVGGEQTGAVSLDLIVLLAETKLNSEPVHLCGKKRPIKIHGLYLLRTEIKRLFIAGERVGSRLAVMQPARRARRAGESGGRGRARSRMPAGGRASDHYGRCLIGGKKACNSLLLPNLD